MKIAARRLHRAWVGAWVAGAGGGFSGVYDQLTKLRDRVQLHHVLGFNTFPLSFHLALHGGKPFVPKVGS